MLLRSLTKKAGQRPFTARLVFLFAIGVISTLAFLASSLQDAEPALAQGGGPEMKLDVTRGGTCDGSTCTVAISGVFTLSIEVVQAPAQAYLGAQSFIDFGSELTYNMTEDIADEIIWPDCSTDVAVRAQFSPQHVNHGCLTGLIPPLPVTMYTGELVNLSFTCSSAPSSSLIRLLPLDDVLASSSGAGFKLEDQSVAGADVSDLTIACAADVAPVPTITPGGPTRTPRPTATPGGPADTPADSDSTPRPTEDDGVANGTSDDDSGDDDGQTILIIAIIVAVIVVGGGGAVFFVRRQRGAPPSEQE